jgi:hypothetical protein
MNNSGYILLKGEKVMKKSKAPYFIIGLMLIILFFSLSPTFAAQKALKKLTYEQVYQNAQPRIFERMSSIRNWLDDEQLYPKLAR